MRRTLLAFFGLAFVLYWISTAELPRDPAESLDPVRPSIVRLPNAAPSASTPTEKLPVQHWIKSESQRVGKIDSDPENTLKRLKTRATQLSASELIWLKQTAVDTHFDGDTRFLAVFLLGLAQSPTALQSLKEIGQSPIVATDNDRLYSDEVVVRARALESVVRQLSPAESASYLREVLRHTPDPAVAQHAKYWLSRLT